MNIAIIGAGNVGRSLATASVRAGHRVAISSAKPEDAQRLAAETGAAAVGSNREAVNKADLVILAVPFDAVREIVENLLHAEFRGATISVYPGGNQILVADQGPGIPDKEAAFRPGFSTSSSDMRRFIKGVGSGLTVARKALEEMGGSLLIEDNLHGGTVVTLTVPDLASSRLAAAEVAVASEPLESEPSVAGDSPPQGEYKRDSSSRVSAPKAVRKAKAATSRQTSKAGLTPRQERVLCLFADCPELGPSTVAERGEISLASAYRDLVALEGLGLAEPVEGGKRRLTDKGRECLASFSK
jgi:NAD(P)-dependent dehydrogenase (short-subunit alcohol dehydrogenase family)